MDNAIVVYLLMAGCFGTYYSKVYGSSFSFLQLLFFSLVRPSLLAFDLLNFAGRLIGVKFQVIFAVFESDEDKE